MEESTSLMKWFNPTMGDLLKLTKILHSTCDKHDVFLHNANGFPPQPFVLQIILPSKLNNLA